MPKEIAHMSVAQDLRRFLPIDSIFYDPIQKFSNLFLYGSVAPDTCFFYLAGPGSSGIRQVSQIFHQSDASTVIPILKLLKKYGPGQPDALAFAAGLICHLITDTVFHPMVFYFSGSDDIHEGATHRHRMFETAMDMHFRSMNPFSATLSPPRVLSDIEISNFRLSALLHNLFCPEKTGYQKNMFYAFKSHWLANQLFLKGKLMKVFSAFKIELPLEYRVLFYPFSDLVELDFFNRALSYQDPEKGVSYKQTVDELVRQSKKRCAAFLSITEKWLRSDDTLDDFLSNPELPQIRPCQPLDQKRFNYWHGPCDFEKMMYGDLNI